MIYYLEMDKTVKSLPRLLVIEAHSDDSAISASAFLEKHRDKCDIHFALLTVSDINLHHAGELKRDTRIIEYANYVKHFKGHWHREENLPFDADSRLDTIPKREIISAIENIIKIVKPGILIVQGPSFHQDHTLVYEATIAATRPTALHCPDEIYIMENPTYVHSIGPSTDFKPDLYVSMTEKELNKKLELFKKYFPSQVRDEPNSLSLEGIKAWSRYRGIESRTLYAEAFKTYRRVI